MELDWLMGGLIDRMVFRSAIESKFRDICRSLIRFLVFET